MAVLDQKKKIMMKQEKKSVCEKSMQLVVNIIRLSSFSLATMSLGQLIPIKSFKGYTPNSQQMSTSSKAPLSTKSYIMEHDHHYHLSPSSRFMILETKANDGNFSDYINRFHRRIKNEVNTDGKASAYIREFHEKNSRDYTLASSTSLPLVMPPPPPSFNKY